MKNKILFFIIAAVGALLITASNGFSKSSYGDNVNDACAPEAPFTGNCLLCHTENSYSDSHPGKDAYKAGGTDLTDYFCPTQPACTDNDGDGYAVEEGDCGPFDCNDNDEFVNPGAVEICNDGIDNDCDGYTDIFDLNSDCPVDCTDSDNDGFSIEGVAAGCGPVDCVDDDASINPDITEHCNDGIDNDCDLKIDSKDLDCYTCGQYTDRGSCKADPRCKYSGKNKECFQPVVYDNRLDCEEAGGRWNNKKESCSVR